LRTACSGGSAVRRRRWRCDEDGAAGKGGARGVGAGAAAGSAAAAAAQPRSAQDDAIRRRAACLRRAPTAGGIHPEQGHATQKRVPSRHGDA
jgi:hypothetical protein